MPPKYHTQKYKSFYKVTAQKRKGNLTPELTKSPKLKGILSEIPNSEQSTDRGKTVL